MKLAEVIIIELAGEAFSLRPSLRYAMRLEGRAGGFRQLLTDISDGSLTAALDIIRPHVAGSDSLEADVLDALPDLNSALTDYVLACTGFDPAEKPSTDKSKGKPQPFGDYLIGLYKIGTGWLDWSPETTLDATPAEISLAYQGKLEMLKAIYGGSEKSAPKDERPLDEKFRSIFAGLGTSKEAAQ